MRGYYDEMHRRTMIPNIIIIDMNSDNLKQRLNQLKKATSDLKERVNKDDTVEKSAINALLSVVPKDRSHRNQYILEVEDPSKQQSPLTPTGNQGSMVLALFANNSQSTDKSGSEKKQAVMRDTHELEGPKMQKETEELQRQLAELTTSIRELRRIQKEVFSERWKAQIPFMSRSGELGLFPTKLVIEEVDFDKIDYEKGKIDLDCQTLYLTVINKPQRYFLLSNLGEVIYIGCDQMRLQFKGEPPVYVYFQFQSEQQRKSWDLAVFVNRSILTSPDFDRSLFTDENSSLTPNEKDKSVHFNVPDKNHSQSSVSKNSSMRSLKVSYARSQPQQYTLNKSPSGSVPFKNSAVSVDIGDQRQDLQVFGGGGSSHNDNQSNTHTSKFNINDTIQDPMDIYQTFMPSPETIQPPQTPQLVPSLSPPKYEPTPIKYEPIKYQPPQPFFPSAPSSPKELPLIEKARNQLKNGFYFTKFARNGLNPHDKRVYINQMETNLLSADTKSEKDTKVIPLSKITAIRNGQIGQGIEKHVSTPNRDYFCLIEYDTDEEAKVLEFGAQKPSFINNFCLYLREVIRMQGLPPPQ